MFIDIILNCVTSLQKNQIASCDYFYILNNKKHGVECKFNIFMAELHSEFCYLVEQRQIRQISGAEK